MKSLKCIGGFTLALSLLSSTALAQQNSASITVQADRSGPKIERDIFGQFAEHLGTGIYGGVWVGKNSSIPNVRGIRTDVVQALRAIKVPNVRWPGGCFADEYHWRDGIGDPKKRPVTVNANWGGSIEDNAFGTHEFFDFIDQIGSEAYVSINLGSGTYQEAADWVAYMTADTRNTAGQQRAANGHKAPWKIRYLGIGNESWGCGGSMRPETYVDELKRFSRFSRNYNPDQQGTDNPQAMRRVAVGPDDKDTRYTEAVMKAWKDRDWAWGIEGLSLHSYTVIKFPAAYDSVNFGEKEYAEILKATLRMNDLIAMHGAIMDRYDPEKKVPLIIDEWGTWYAKLPGSPEGYLQQQNSLRDAIVTALNFNIFARHADRVRGANIAQMVNVLQAMILTDDKRMVLTPTYYVHKMYLPFQDATLVPTSLDTGEYRFGDIRMPQLDAVAVRDKEGKLWLSLTNVDPNRTMPVRVRFAGVQARAASGEQLTAPAVNSVNSFDAPGTVTPRAITAQVDDGAVVIDLPAKLVTMLAIEP